jgi:hypothetical protein
MSKRTYSLFPWPFQMANTVEWRLWRETYAWPCGGRLPDWDVDMAEAKIRGTYELSGGGIDDQNGALEGTDVIGNAVGELTFVRGRDLLPSHSAIATAITQPACKSPILCLLYVS